MIRVIRKSYADLSHDDLKDIGGINDDFGGLIFHEAEFNHIVQESFNTELTYWLAYSQQGGMIGFCPMHSQKHGFLKYSYASPTHLGVPFGGWVFDSSKVSHDELLGKMKYSLNEVGLYFSSIQYPHNTFTHTKLPLKMLSTPIIDLSQSIDDIWTMSLKSSRRNRVRKAQKEGVIVKTYGAEGVDLILPSLKDLHKMHHLPDKPDTFYHKIIEYYAPKNQATVFTAEKEGQILSGCIVIGNQRYMHGWEAGVRENVPSIGLFEIMYWENIVWAKETGSAYMDFCVIDEVNLPQIAFFKLEFTSKIVPFYHMVISNSCFKVLSRLQKYYPKNK
jgi:hypothetical protein